MSCATEIERKGTKNILMSQAIYLKIVHFLNNRILFLKIYTVRTEITTIETKRIYKQHTRVLIKVRAHVCVKGTRKLGY